MTNLFPVWLGRALSLVGIVIVAFSIWRQAPDASAWVIAAVALSLAGWAALVLLRDAAPVAVFFATAASGALTLVATDGISVVPVIVAVLLSLGSPTRPIWAGAIVVFLAVVLTPVGLVFGTMSPLALVSIEAGLGLALLGGINRRQARTAIANDRELLEQRARSTVLAERQAVARDLHDVLAHSLGGLVLQLDAIDAQLDAGKVSEAAIRVRQARELAASGLADARLAVDALRSERDGVTAAAEISHVVTELIESHRRFGGVVDVTMAGVPRDLPTDRADALGRALQESLTNARRHAPGATVVIALSWGPPIELDVSNVLAARPDRPDDPTGGHGLRGMAERFTSLGAVSAGEVGGRFVVHARVDS